jgi:hypothetical protein
MTDIFGTARNTASSESGFDGLIRRPLGAGLQGVLSRLGVTSRAHGRRRSAEAIGPETMRDTGLPPETASGIPAWQADLPFFMQSGFGKR